MNVRSLHRDERGLAGFSLLRWILALVLVGLVVIEGGSIIFTTISLSNAADAAASEAVDIWVKEGDINEARLVALDALAARSQEDARIPPALFEADGPPDYEVRFTVIKEAPTLILHRIDFLKDLGVVEVETKASPIEAGV
jgi:hypothetical protein